MKYFYPFLFTVFFTVLCSAQKPIKQNPSQIYESIKKVNFLGSVLYIAAHPDDENTRLISYFSNHIKARTGYLSMTRGDGGQNLIGSEIGPLLGVIRTQELLAARGIDGGEQFFTRANDFGYSKHPDETLTIWNKEEVLKDVVSRIRKFKPDVIINRFNHRTPGSTHGHHTSSAMLSIEAFDLANDATYKTHKGSTDLWQPKRAFFNTSWWFYGSQKKFAEADKSKMLNFDVGVYYPSKGLSNNEVAAIASSQHLCQGFGRLTQRGSEQEYIEFLKGDFPEDTSNVFDGIDTSWNRVKGGKAIGEILEDIEQDFNFKDPSVHLSDLVKAYQLLQKIDNEHWKLIKTKELLEIIQSCAGLYLEVSASSPKITASEKVELSFEVLNRSNANIRLKSIKISTNKSESSKDILIKNNIKERFKDSLFLALTNLKYTTPYWLQDKGSLGMYLVHDEQLIGMPETPRGVIVDFNLEINGLPITVTKPVVHRYAKPDKGELYKPFEIVPEVSVKTDVKIIISKPKEPIEINVTVKAFRNNIDGYLTFNLPNDWTASPNRVAVKLSKKGEEKTVSFLLNSANGEVITTVNPSFVIMNESYDKEIIEIDYEHIPSQTVLVSAETKVVRLNIKKKGEHIGYIQGAGDNIPESLRQIGYKVTELTTEDITQENLQQFDAVVLGLRAYNIDDNAKFYQAKLHEFVKQGGNLLVQYNTSRRQKVAEVAPYKLKLSRDRVTDENAEVRFLNKKHEVLNYPNRITQEDFIGWVQERGLYFPNEWDNAFTPILSMNDKGETPKDGSLLVAKYGKGYFVYTGLSFFRELPAGVPGAYRLFANLVSIGKNESKQSK
jgi:LmbE family N-acetylglucosaminyl deacetylase